MRGFAILTLVGALALPFFASAVTVEELRAQVQELLQRIDALQQNISTGSSNAGGVSSAATSVNPGGAVACPHVSRSIKKGDSGDDVARLQQFLALDPSVYPEALVTGYYGALTEAAVKRFQCKNNIVCEGTPDSTGYGLTGPRTAAILALQCPGATTGGGTGASDNVGGFMRVTPISGNAPINVSIEATVNTTNSCAAANYEIDFGDGSAQAYIPVPANTCGELRQVFNHTYDRSGVYTVTLRSGVHRTTATVTVSGSGSAQTVQDSFGATPTSGDVPFSVTFEGTINGGAVCNAGSYTLDFGNGSTASLPVSGCVPNSYSVTHTYTSAGNFVAKLRRSNSTEVGSVSIAATGTSGSGSEGGGTYGGFFSVSPSTTGDFSTVSVQFDLETSCSAYDLDWGDASPHITHSAGSCSGGVVTKEISHTYASSGSYTIVLKRGENLSDVDTAGITISE